MHPAALLWLFLASVKQNMALPRNVIPARSRVSDTLFYFDASAGSVSLEIQRLRPLSRVWVILCVSAHLEQSYSSRRGYEYFLCRGSDAALTHEGTQLWMQGEALSLHRIKYNFKWKWRAFADGQLILRPENESGIIRKPHWWRWKHTEKWISKQQAGSQAG